MSSSYRLKKRKEIYSNYNFGSEFDHYIEPFRQCHPDYNGVLIGDNPHGVRVCVKKNIDSKPIDLVTLPNFYKDENYDNRAFKENNNNTITSEYFKYSADLYDPKTNDYNKSQSSRLPRTLNQPFFYYDRRVPYEDFHYSHNYFRAPIKYNESGIKSTRTPTQHNPQQKYYEYAFDDNNIQPRKYDVTQLNQRYDVWKDSQIKML